MKGEKVIEEDMILEKIDKKLRRIRIKNGEKVIMQEKVGFI